MGGKADATRKGSTSGWKSPFTDLGADFLFFMAGEDEWFCYNSVTILPERRVGHFLS
jgi:hypothetical protein